MRGDIACRTGPTGTTSWLAADNTTAVRINLIFHDNGAGLTTDARILTDVLRTAGGHTVSWSPREPPPRLARWRARLGRRMGRPMYDLNIFLEHLDPRWWPLAGRNFLIPNQEWFSPLWSRHLRGLDRVLCKTEDALQLFEALGAPAEFLGFSSDDQRLDPAPPRVAGALHIAGRSLRKGTVAVIQAWYRHPEWPPLTVVQRPPRDGYRLWHPEICNVTYLADRLSDAEVRELQNRFWLHIRPSEAEGFGHPFAESMSCEAVVITTDAPPMNELIGPDRGILVPGEATEVQGLVRRHEVQVTALERAVQQALAMSTHQREVMGRNARGWWEHKDREFRRRLLAAVQP